MSCTLPLPNQGYHIAVYSRNVSAAGLCFLLSGDYALSVTLPLMYRRGCTTSAGREPRDMWWLGWHIAAKGRSISAKPRAPGLEQCRVRSCGKALQLVHPCPGHTIPSHSRSLSQPLMQSCCTASVCALLWARLWEDGAALHLCRLQAP